MSCTLFVMVRKIFAHTRKGIIFEYPVKSAYFIRIPLAFLREIIEWKSENTWKAPQQTGATNVQVSTSYGQPDLCRRCNAEVHRPHCVGLGGTVRSVRARSAHGDRSRHAAHHDGAGAFEIELLHSSLRTYWAPHGALFFLVKVDLTGFDSGFFNGQPRRTAKCGRSDRIEWPPHRSWAQSYPTAT